MKNLHTHTKLNCTNEKKSKINRLFGIGNQILNLFDGVDHVLTHSLIRTFSLPFACLLTRTLARSLAAIPCSSYSKVHILCVR